MTAEKKAEELLREFSFLQYNQVTGKPIDNPTLKEAAKQCANIVVDAVLQALKYDMNSPTHGSVIYWNKVKEHIQKTTTPLP